MAEETWWRAIARFGAGDQEVRWAGAWKTHLEAATQCSEWSEERCCGAEPVALWIESVKGDRLNGDFMLSG